jgi:hypothetical protein
VLYSPLVFRKAGMSSNKTVLGAAVGVVVVKMCFVLVAALLSTASAGGRSSSPARRGWPIISAPGTTVTAAGAGLHGSILC